MAAKVELYAPKAWDFVVVTWEDAQTDSSAQYGSPKDALDAYIPCIRKSTGYFCGRTKDVVAFAIDDDRSVYSKNAIGGISYIPAGMVRDITPVIPLKVSTKRA